MMFLEAAESRETLECLRRGKGGVWAWGAENLLPFSCQPHMVPSSNLCPLLPSEVKVLLTKAGVLSCVAERQV